METSKAGYSNLAEDLEVEYKDDDKCEKKVIDRKESGKEKLDDQKLYYEIEILKRENDRLEQINARYNFDTKTREKLKKNVFSISIIWLLFIMFIIILQGVSIGDDRFSGLFKGVSFYLSDIAMSTLLGGTTVTVASLLVIVIKGLFKKDEQQ